MDAYCTVQQYRAKYPYCDLDDSHLSEWLSDATEMAAKVVSEAGADASETGDGPKATLKRVVRDMVHRAIGDGSSYMNGMQGSTQFFATGEGYSQTVNMGNGFADLYMRKQERADVLEALRDAGLTEYGARSAAVAVPSYGVFDAGA